MDNCVASYASHAVRGSSLLFHVEKDGEAATVEVSARGYVAQAAGPRNRRNAAVKWGERALKRLGKKFPEEARAGMLAGATGRPAKRSPRRVRVPSGAVP